MCACVIVLSAAPCPVVPHVCVRANRALSFSPLSAAIFALFLCKLLLTRWRQGQSTEMGWWEHPQQIHTHRHVRGHTLNYNTQFMLRRASMWHMQTYTAEQKMMYCWLSDGESTHRCSHEPITQLLYVCLGSLSNSACVYTYSIYLDIWMSKNHRYM